MHSAIRRTTISLLYYGARRDTKSYCSKRERERKKKGHYETVEISLSGRPLQIAYRTFFSTAEEELKKYVSILSNIKPVLRIFGDKNNKRATRGRHLHRTSQTERENKIKQKKTSAHLFVEDKGWAHSPVMRTAPG